MAARTAPLQCSPPLRKLCLEWKSFNNNFAVISFSIAYCVEKWNITTSFFDGCTLSTTWPCFSCLTKKRKLSPCRDESLNRAIAIFKKASQLYSRDPREPQGKCCCLHIMVQQLPQRRTLPAFTDIRLRSAITARNKTGNTKDTHLGLSYLLTRKSTTNALTRKSTTNAFLLWIESASYQITHSSYRHFQEAIAE